jgi:polar amino acid transport system permease protein
LATFEKSWHSLRRLFWRSSDELRAPLPFVVVAINWILAFLLLSLLCVYSFSRIQYTWNWDSVTNYSSMFWSGWVTTLQISAVSLLLSSFIGLVAALVRRSGVLMLRALSRIYVEAIRGTPLLVQISFGFYVVGTAFHVADRFLVGVTLLSFFSGAYISEIIRAGIESIGASQLESARAIGLTKFQTYYYVIFPQAIRVILPGLAGMFASLIKDSSLLSIIAISEFTYNAQQVAGLTYSQFEVYVPMAFGYLILTLPISLWTQSLERRTRFET